MHLPRLTFVAACALPSLVILPGQAAAQDRPAGETMEEIVVTAQKRGPENVLGLPLSISVLNRERIARSSFAGMDDYLRALPTANFLERGAGRNNIILRGVSSDPQREATVGVYIDEVPVTGLGTYGVGNPDLKLIDVERVEVLRGPQGTLYGDGSMGGTVRIMPARADLSDLEVSAAVDFSATNGSGGPNTALQGMLNLPISRDSLALRLVGYRFDNSGYYENVAASDTMKSVWGEAFGGRALSSGDIGADEYTGGRVMLEWVPRDAHRLSVTLLSQDIEQSGLPEAAADLKKYQQARFGKLVGAGEALTIDFDVANVVVEHDFDSFTLVSSTAFVQTGGLQDRDVGIFFASALGVGDIPLFLTDVTQHQSRVQELRFTSSLPGKVQYVTGLYYQNLDTTTTQDFLFEGAPQLDPFGGALLFDSIDDRSMKQEAIFADFIYDFTDRLSVSFGVRLYDYEQRTSIVSDGLFNGGMTTDVRGSDDSGTTSSLTLDYAVNGSLLAFVRFAEGFRLGGPHPLVPASVCDVDGDEVIDGIGARAPDDILSDDLETYEVGVKWARRGRLLLSSSLFFSDWTGIPVTQLAPCGFPVTLNARGAETNGVEVEGVWSLNDVVRVNFGGSYVDPALTEDAPALGMRGDRLPGVPRFQATLGLQRDFDLANRPAFVRLDLVHVDDFHNNLQQTGTPAGGYSTLGLLAGVELGAFQVDVYGDNLTDETGLTWVDTEVGDGRRYVLRPRTYGIKLDYRFAPN